MHYLIFRTTMLYNSRLTAPNNIDSRQTMSALKDNTNTLADQSKAHDTKMAASRPGMNPGKDRGQV
jgi:hypothetical protein